MIYIYFNQGPFFIECEMEKEIHFSLVGVKKFITYYKILNSPRIKMYHLVI